MDYRNATNKKEHPKIVISTFGKVESREVDDIIEIVKECYSRLQPHEVALVDLYFFEKSSSMNVFMAKELREVGVVSASFDELFFAMHDAYRGTSRITLCLERLKKLAKPVQVGGIRHEVAHSVLHGNLLYYVFPLPPALLSFVDRLKFSREYATNLLYLISIAVKDYEVSSLLNKCGYVEDQIAYAKHLLTVSESDKLSWQMARGKPFAEILCLVSYLKTAGCAAPFLSNKIYGEQMRELLAESFSFLSRESSIPLLNIILKGFPYLGTDTLSNINYIAGLVVKNIVEPILLG
mgnify:CR=1 FL=1